MIKYSIIIPVFNEEAVLWKLHEELLKNFEKLDGDCEFILVNDGSWDRTAIILDEFSSRDSRFKAIHFSRNFGHQPALAAGFDHASGEAIITMDADLQDPPEVVFEFIEKWKKGYDVVYGIRTKRKEWFGKRLAYWSFYRLLRWMSSFDVPFDAGDFSLMDKRVVEAVRSFPEKTLFIRGFRSWVGFKQCGVMYARRGRFAGTTKYSLRKLFKLASDGIFSFSFMPIKLIRLVGVVVIGLSIIGGIFLFYLVELGNVYKNWLLPSIFFVGGINLMALAILGEYISRIYEEVRGRPIYIIRNKTGF